MKGNCGLSHYSLPYSAQLREPGEGKRVPENFKGGNLSDTKIEGGAKEFGKILFKPYSARKK